MINKTLTGEEEIAPCDKVDIKQSSGVKGKAEVAEKNAHEHCPVTSPVGTMFPSHGAVFENKQVNTIHKTQGVRPELKQVASSGFKSHPPCTLDKLKRKADKEIWNRQAKKWYKLAVEDVRKIHHDRIKELKEWLKDGEKSKVKGKEIMLEIYDHLIEELERLAGSVEG